jgi:5-methylcytosine-specific restriction protein A
MATGKTWDHRLSRHERGYGAHWVKLRRIVLQRDKYLCQPCRRNKRLSVAAAVDHVRPKAKGGTDELENLEAICDPCHRAKSARDRGVTLKPRKTIGPDGWALDD